MYGPERSSPIFANENGGTSVTRTDGFSCLRLGDLANYTSAGSHQRLCQFSDGRYRHDNSRSVMKWYIKSYDWVVLSIGQIIQYIINDKMSICYGILRLAKLYYA